MENTNTDNSCGLLSQNEIDKLFKNSAIAKEEKPVVKPKQIRLKGIYVPKEEMDKTLLSQKELDLLLIPKESPRKTKSELLSQEEIDKILSNSLDPSERDKIKVYDTALPAPFTKGEMDELGTLFSNVAIYLERRLSEKFERAVRVDFLGTDQFPFSYYTFPIQEQAFNALYSYKSVSTMFMSMEPEVYAGLFTDAKSLLKTSVSNSELWVFDGTICKIIEESLKKVLSSPKMEKDIVSGKKYVQCHSRPGEMGANVLFELYITDDSRPKRLGRISFWLGRQFYDSALVSSKVVNKVPSQNLNKKANAYVSLGSLNVSSVSNGDILILDKEIGAFVDLVKDGKTVAKGQILAMEMPDSNETYFGIRVSEVL